MIKNILMILNFLVQRSILFGRSFRVVPRSFWVVSRSLCKKIKKLFVGERTAPCGKRKIHVTRLEWGGKLSEVMMIGGVRHGLATYWHKSGPKKSEVLYFDGKKEGLATYWYERGGSKKSEVLYVDDKKEGLETNWYESGSKKSEVLYVDGKSEGLATRWHENGSKY